MKPRTIEREKYWWVWPKFIEEKDARDVAMWGLIACVLIAVVGGAVSDQAITAVVTVTLYLALGYGIFKMSKFASSVALVLYGTTVLYSVVVEHKFPGMLTILVIWYLVQANRATYWFKSAKKKSAKKMEKK